MHPKHWRRCLNPSLHPFTVLPPLLRLSNSPVQRAFVRIFPLTHLDPVAFLPPLTADVFALLRAFASCGHPFTQRFQASEPASYKVFIGPKHQECEDFDCGSAETARRRHESWTYDVHQSRSKREVFTGGRRVIWPVANCHAEAPPFVSPRPLDTRLATALSPSHSPLLMMRIYVIASGQASGAVVPHVTAFVRLGDCLPCSPSKSTTEPACEKTVITAYRPFYW
ncbi:hypothetical protein EGR_02918 [Echinococcus granulosus]|uniref:Uncharacterized protein n=1 Tax=Echinococcus granulosus TaxID=6210 RepID=W6UM00_ECHGR|nr:hypothetical protein EGR_02918 [Echinococcus granulosus]EUB62166.1 hypothetical protein EGR_02918 [Echinococcus granulosus]